jgi:hypothetical protein
LAVAELLTVYTNNGFYAIAHDDKLGRSLAMPIDRAKHFMLSQDSKFIHVLKHVGNYHPFELKEILKNSNVNSVYIYAKDRMDLFILAAINAHPTINDMVCVESIGGKLMPYDPIIRRHGSKVFNLKDIHGTYHKTSLISLNASSGEHTIPLGKDEFVELIKKEIGKEAKHRTIAENPGGLSSFNTVRTLSIAERANIARFRR